MHGPGHTDNAVAHAGHADVVGTDLYAEGSRVRAQDGVGTIARQRLCQGERGSPVEYAGRAARGAGDGHGAAHGVVGRRAQLDAEDAHHGVLHLGTQGVNLFLRKHGV